jgi:hypothetical protein
VSQLSHMPPPPVAPPLNPAGGWIPSASPAVQAARRSPHELPDHAGQPLPPEADFFHPPPPQLGRLLSANSTLRRHNDPWGWTGKLFVSGLVAVIMAGALIAVDYNNGGHRSADYWAFAVMGAMIGAAAFGAICYFTRAQYHCTYVGEAGVARFTLRGSRARPPRAEVLLFQHAVELRSGETKQYLNGVYTGTVYTKTWTDAAGRRLLHLSGGYFDGFGAPASNNPIYFCEAAELAWSHHLLQTLPAQLQQFGFLHFNVGPGQGVRVGPGFFEFCLGSEVHRLTPAEIKSVSLHQGVFQVCSTDARWFSSRGKFSFDYSHMANGRLFLVAVERLIGYRLA